GAEAELAAKYFNDGEYASALELYLKVNRRQYDELLTQRIVSCYEALGDFSSAIDYLERAEKRQEDVLIFPALRASLLEKSGDVKAAGKLYDELIRKRLRSEGDFIQIGAFLFQAGKLALALETYETGRKELRDPYLFCNETANIHTLQGDYRRATEEYLNLYYRDPIDLSSANLAILNMVGPQTQDAIEQALLQAVDKRQSDLGLRTILFEFYVLAENFEEAFVQVRSIDRLFREDGRRVYDFALTMRNNQNFELSNRALDYILERKENSPYYFRAHFEKATNGELQAFSRIPVDMDAIKRAVADYGRLLDEFGRRPQYFDAIYRRAYLMIFYLNQLEAGQQELEMIVRQPQMMAQEDWAKAKLLIGDVLLMQEDYNRAKLTYTEVSETFRDRQLGALAKYKLGQLAYYKGEFNLAQALL
ncbi:MAG: hypothetical protein D6722_09425, partial [Bacteroidetes bacterium]